VRNKAILRALDIMEKWIAEGEPEPEPDDDGAPR
jgi:hypothetical protein